jgi:hypothetical protein
MDFIEQIQLLAGKIAKMKDTIQTEEATKTAFIMPFITALGYDVFDPSEVIPEFVMDVGTKKGEKVDYVILHDKQPIMIFECKKIGSALDLNHASQLYRYYSVGKARFGILTDGAVYRFYTDLEEANKMDQRPFLEVDISNPQHPLIPELKRFAKSSFNLEELLEVSKTLKYMGGIKTELATQMNSPAEDFVRFFAGRVYPGQMRQQVLTQFQDIVKRAFAEFINDQISARLRSALESGSSSTKDSPASHDSSSPNSAEELAKSIETLPEEVEGFFTIRAILRQTTDPKRIARRDSKTYFSVLLDDNNRKPICRLYFHGKQRYVGLFDEKKEESREKIEDLTDLFRFADKLQHTVHLYDSNKISEAKEVEDSHS